MFDWKPPDLSEGGAWFLDRVYSLIQASVGLSNLGKVIQEGLELLWIHRGNYDADMVPGRPLDFSFCGGSSQENIRQPYEKVVE